jgi:hypothetical protein
MKLAIAAVYLAVDRLDERLLEVHLNQIEKNTSEPYLLYAAANRLPVALRQALARHPNVKVLDLPATGLRGNGENAFYLELLVETAIGEGATHVCTLHMDSFPVRPGWATKLAGQLTGDVVLAGMERDPYRDKKPLTAFLLFTREFYLAYRPTFSLPAESLGTPEYHRYAQSHPHIPDSGTGYGFTVFREGLSWYPLARTDRGPDGWGFGIFGNLIFHLGGAQWFPMQDALAQRRPNPWMPWLERLGRVASLVLPGGLRSRIGELAPWAWQQDLGSRRTANRKSALVASPEAFLRNLGVG